jgi:MAternally-affected-uncoordination protein
MKNWFTRFPTILQGCESTIENLRGQYAHSVGCFDEAAFHFLEAKKVLLADLLYTLSRLPKE